MERIFFELKDGIKIEGTVYDCLITVHNPQYQVDKARGTYKFDPGPELSDEEMIEVMMSPPGEEKDPEIRVSCGHMCASNMNEMWLEVWDELRKRGIA